MRAGSCLLIVIFIANCVLCIVKFCVVESSFLYWELTVLCGRTGFCVTKLGFVLCFV